VEAPHFRAVLAAARHAAAELKRLRAEEQAADQLPPRRAAVAERVFAPPSRLTASAMPAKRGSDAAVPGRSFSRPARHAATVEQPEHQRDDLAATSPIPLARRKEPESGSGEIIGFAPETRRGSATGPDLGQALRAYFFQQSRLPPAASPCFDPTLTPLWAGVKIPG
jgi:hypothetical protein